MESASSSLQDLEDVFRVCTYHRYEFDDLLVRTQDSKLQAPFLHSTFNASASSGLGALDRLPKELILMIVRELDIASYLRFRGVNHKARNLATDRREYIISVQHGLAGLKALLRVRFAHLFTVVAFYQALISPACHFCGKFGTFLSLTTCQRCCFACLEISSELRVLPIPAPKTFCQAVNVSRQDIERVCEPKLRVLYGKYSLTSWPKVRMPRYLVPAQDALDKLRSINPHLPVCHRSMGCIPEHQSHMGEYHYNCYRYMTTTAFPWYDTGNNRVERGISCKGCNFRVERYAEQHRWGEPPWGFNDRDRIYSEEEFMRHFWSCKYASEVWESAQDRQVIPESRFTLEGGEVVNQRSRHQQY